MEAGISSKVQNQLKKVNASRYRSWYLIKSTKMAEKSHFQQIRQLVSSLLASLNRYESWYLFKSIKSAEKSQSQQIPQLVSRQKHKND